jgi:hexosaminidase
MMISNRTLAVVLLLHLFSVRGALAHRYSSSEQKASPPSVPTSAIGSAGPKLIPEPREVADKESLSLAHGVRVIAGSSETEDRFAAEDLRKALGSRGLSISALGAGRTIELLRLDTPRAAALLSHERVNFDDQMKAEGYVIVPTQAGTAVIGATPEGVFYGAQTIKQLVTGTGASARLNSVVIRDWPAMRYRGIDDDLSRGPVPTLAFQEQQIRTFAAYKLNVYSPYFENTLAYASNPLASAPGGAMTRDDVEALVKYATQYHITIIPEQEAFGHLHNLLSYDTYSGLAETPHGNVIAPGQPGSLPLIRQWFTEISEMFPGPFEHIGADETSDLGKGQTRDLVKQHGLGPVYIDFLKQIYQTLQPLHKRILFWGDIAMNEPALVHELPKDMIAVPWTYDPDPKGYDRFIQPFTNAGMETWVAPGVNNWNRVYPDNNAALANIQGFIRDGQRLGSTGALNAVWNDDGEGLFNEDWYGVLFGAAASWQQGETSIDRFKASYGAVFHGDPSGKIDEAQQELMQAHQLLYGIDEEGATDNLFWVDPWSADGKIAAKKMRPVSRQLRMHAERALILLAEAKAEQRLQQQGALAAMELGARRIDMIGMKFEFADEIAAAYARALAEQSDPKQSDDVSSALYEISDTNGRCQDIRNAYSLIRDLYEQAWMSENRPYWVRNVLVRYDMAIQLWNQRGNSVSSSLNQWDLEHTLPKASELGMPDVQQ